MILKLRLAAHEFDERVDWCARYAPSRFRAKVTVQDKGFYEVLLPGKISVCEALGLSPTRPRTLNQLFVPDFDFEFEFDDDDDAVMFKLRWCDL